MPLDGRCHYKQQFTFTFEGGKTVKVISADTDVFVILCEMFFNNGWSVANEYMDSFTKDEKIISINGTVEKNLDLVPYLIPLNAISGCDSVPILYGFGKGTALKAGQTMKLVHLGNSDAELQDFITEGKLLVANCYGLQSISSSNNCQSIW